MVIDAAVLANHKNDMKTYSDTYIEAIRMESPTREYRSRCVARYETNVN